MAKTISLDFDGVLHSYKSGWQGPRTILDPPVPGAIDFLLRLIAEGWDVAIFSSRSVQWGGRRAMKRWLRGYAAMHWMDAMDERATVKKIRQSLWHLAGYRSGMDPIDEEADFAGKWLVKQVRWPVLKPAAFVGLDDRVIQFEGSFPSLDTLDSFRPWNKPPGLQRSKQGGAGDAVQSHFLDDYGAKAARDHLSSLLATHNISGERDDKGIPYIADDGSLEPWANYVATDDEEVPRQFRCQPIPNNKAVSKWEDPMHLLYGETPSEQEAPPHFAITDRHWTETLRRIKR